MMQVKVLFFGALSEQLAIDKLTWSSLVPGNTAAELKTQLLQQGEHWRALGASNILCAVNQSIKKEHTVLHDGDEVAFFPPVTGG